MTEAELCARLKAKLTEAVLRDALDDAADEDDRGRACTDVGSVVAFLCDWLAQECCDEEPIAAADGTGHP